MSADGPRRIEPGGPLRGWVRPPGDKSISHRALLLGALGAGPARVRGLLGSDDVRRTAAALVACGVGVETRGAEVVVTPAADPIEPDDVIDCGNSGTTIRLLTGWLAAGRHLAVLTGDRSLRRRPMRRVVEPLRVMGARIDGRRDGALAPLVIRGGPLERRAHELPVASAQVKSALLLAGLSCGVSVREPGASRDHTERMLVAMGADLRRSDDGWLHLEPGGRLAALDLDVPGDPSSAAFWWVAAAVVPGSEIEVRDVGLNPTRTGALDALRLLGARVEVEVTDPGVEPRGVVRVAHGPLTGARIDGELALRSLDELPVLAVAAAFAEGETVIADAAELRVKESDRVASVVAGLRALGIDAEERPDGMRIRGGVPRGPARIDASDDHRLAMAFAVAGLASPGGVELAGAGSIGTSYPDFFQDLARLRSR